MLPLAAIVELFHVCLAIDSPQYECVTDTSPTSTFSIETGRPSSFLPAFGFMINVDHNARQRIMALTVLARVTELVHDIARTGEINQGRTEFLLHSLFVETDDPSSIYADEKNMQQAMHKLLTLLHGDNLEAMKRSMPHIMSLISLEKKLSKQADMLEVIAKGMSNVAKQKAYFGSLTHESVIAALADIYGSTLSSMSPRVIIRGKPEFLQVTFNTNTIRALLLVGIRAAYIWRTHGGHKWRLIFGRGAMIRDVEHILDSLKEPIPTP